MKNDTASLTPAAFLVPCITKWDIGIVIGSEMSSSIEVTVDEIECDTNDNGSRKQDKVKNKDPLTESIVRTRAYIGGIYHNNKTTAKWILWVILIAGYCIYFTFALLHSVKENTSLIVLTVLLFAYGIYCILDYAFHIHSRLLQLLSTIKTKLAKPWKKVLRW